jgi:small-conductance mechanosensitive channel
MDSIFLGINTLIISWITAILLAGLSVFFIVRTSQFAFLVSWLESSIKNDFVLRNSRLIMAGSFGIGISLFLGILMGLEPDQNSTILLIFRDSLTGPNWSRYFHYFDDIFIIFGIIFLAAFIPISNFAFSRVCNLIDNLRDTRFRVVRIQSLEIFTPNQMVGVLVLIAKYVRSGVVVAIFILFFILVFSLYPQTDGLAQSLLLNINEALLSLWEQVLSFIPNLFALIFIALITRLILRLLRFFYNGLERGKIRFSSIHPEVVEPTYQLMRFLVIAFALVAAFPYIPGSSSPMFRGLSIFVGFLISLGSTSLVTNIISGIVLTYSRGLKIGDRVKIGETFGDVIDRTLLVTRVKTIKNEVITIPNVVVMQNEIVNFSAEARRDGLILHTSVTIGYDEPWRHVQELLINAALETGDVLQDPEPFVLKTSLDNHYISYELNAFTDNPDRMEDIYSDLHQNVLDKFNHAKVEIMSPTYFAFRDGHGSTIPKIEVPENGNGNGAKGRKSRTSFNPYREKTQPLGSRS